jgi:hypothetical protein
MIGGAADVVFSVNCNLDNACNSSVNDCCGNYVCTAMLL